MVLGKGVLPLMSRCSLLILPLDSLEALQGKTEALPLPYAST